VISLEDLRMLADETLVVRAQQFRVVSSPISVVLDRSAKLLVHRRARLRCQDMKLGQAGRTVTLAQHVPCVVLVLLQFFGVPGDERSRGLDPQFCGGAEYRVDQFEVQVLLANALHAYGSRLDTEVEPDTARFGHSRKKRDVDAVDTRGCPPAIA